MATGRPGDMCMDPRKLHYHWCGFCGAEVRFGTLCRVLQLVPPCPRCSSFDWRNEIDLMTGPDYRED